MKASIRAIRRSTETGRSEVLAKRGVRLAPEHRLPSNLGCPALKSKWKARRQQEYIARNWKITTN